MDSRDRVILLAAMLVTFVTGSIHCFSVFLIPFEELLQLPRAEVSLFYSFALIFLTVSVLFGYLVYHRIRPGTMIILSCLGAGIGLIVSAFGDTWWEIFFGYSVLFGVANGFAYGYVLQLSGRALEKHKGFAMAAVTAAYAVGSVVFSLILATVVEHVSLASALITLGVVIAASGLLSAAVMHNQSVEYGLPAQETKGAMAINPKAMLIILLWLAYGCSVFAGLMAIGHAAGIVQNLGGSYGLAVWGAVFIGVGSSIGGFYIGWVINPSNMNRWLVALPLISAGFLMVLLFVDSPAVSIGILSFVGFSYGAVIAVYPFAISEYFGPELGPKIYGKVFTAWGIAGLAGPWSAGLFYDLRGSYDVSLGTAGVIALMSAGLFLLSQKKLGESSIQQ